MIMQPTMLSIANWPIFEEVAKFFAFLMRIVYYIGENINVKNVVFYVIIFCVFAKIVLLPIDLINLRNKKISQWITLEQTLNGRRYSKSSIVPYKPKIELEKFIIANKYNYSGSIGIKLLFVQLPLLIMIYSVINKLTTIVPELSNLSESEITALYTFLGNDVRNKPYTSGVGITPFIVVPFLVVLIPSISTAIQNKLNGRKNDLSILTSNLLMLIFSFKFPIYLSIYWMTQSIFSLFVSTIYFFITKNKQKEHYIKQGLDKINKSRAKRGLHPLDEPLDIPKLKVVNTDGE